MTLHLSLPGAHRSNQQQEELREARRVLKEKVRSDWTYPTLPAWRSSGAERRNRAEGDIVDEEERVAGFRFHVPPSHVANDEGNGDGQHVLGLGFDPAEWREREEASETEGEDSSAMSAANTTTKPRSSSSSFERKSKDSSTTAYQSEGPDSVATQLQERRSARKRKRNEALREEMQWNKGLELFINRRNEWCCARPATEVRQAERQQSSSEAVRHMDSGSTSSSSPRTSTSSTTAQISSSRISTPGTSPSATPDGLATIPHPPPPTTTISPPLLQQDLLIPLAPPLLPNHPIRRRISTQMYPEIYSKIILQSRTPSVPINLSTLVKALVLGWKDDGEWPPKAGVVEPSIGKKKGGAGEHHSGGLRHGIKRVLRVTGVVGSGEGKKGGGEG